MRRGALRDALAAQITAGVVTVVDRLDLEAPKTKALAGRLAGLGLRAVPTLLVVSQAGDALARASRNLGWVQVETANHVSAYQIVRHGQILFERGALLLLQEALAPAPEER
jgi:large subunit ribosomal protein L4